MSTVKIGVLLFLGAVGVSLVLCALGPTDQGVTTTALTLAGLGGAVLLCCLAIGRAVGERVPGATVGTPDGPLVSPRVGVILLLVLAAEFGVTRFLANGPASFLVGELAYYLVLFCGGVALARWSRSAPYVAPTVGVIVLTILTGWNVARYVSDPGVQFQYGPERWLFAFHHVTGCMVMLPLDVAVPFGAWFIFSRGPGSGGEHAAAGPLGIGNHHGAPER